MAPHASTPTNVCRVLIGLAVLWSLIGLPGCGRCADDGDFARDAARSAGRVCPRGGYQARDIDVHKKIREPLGRDGLDK
jgi:hypothetical protein